MKRYTYASFVGFLFPWHRQGPQEIVHFSLSSERVKKLHIFQNDQLNILDQQPGIEIIAWININNHWLVRNKYYQYIDLQNAPC